MMKNNRCIIFCFLLLCGGGCYFQPHKGNEKLEVPEKESQMPSSDSKETVSSPCRELTVEVARAALMEMMRESDVEGWGGRVKEVEEEGTWRTTYPCSMDDNDFPIIYRENPPDMPKEMNHVEFLANGEVEIGFWVCDLKEKKFWTSDSEKVCKITPEFYILGHFVDDESGNWEAWGGKMHYR